VESSRAVQRTHLLAIRAINEAAMHAVVGRPGGGSPCGPRRRRAVGGFPVCSTVQASPVEESLCQVTVCGAAGFPHEGVTTKSGGDVAEIHRTTMTPSKLELLSRWLPEQPWYLDTGSCPALAKAGGFRLDDPLGQVGIKVMFVADDSGADHVVYHQPLSYRGGPLKAAEAGLIGTAEHGILGRRWVYDGAHDPAVVAQLLALAQGQAEPQHQNHSDTPEPSVIGGTSCRTRAGPPGPGHLLERRRPHRCA